MFARVARCLGVICPSRHRLALTLTLTVTFASSACAGGPSFDGRVYKSGAVAFELRDVPTAWRRVELGHADLSSLGFRDDATESSIMVSGRCGLRSDDAPLEALTNHLLIGTTEREYLSQETTSFDGREARHTTLRAKLDGVVMTYAIVVLKKDGCIYDFVRVAPPGRFDAGVAPFEGFVHGFHALGPMTS